jgi:hypothetical protein
MDESLREQGLTTDDESSYALEGTLAHALGELEASLYFGLITKRKYGTEYKKWLAQFDAQKYEPGTLKEMKEHVASYVALIEERLQRRPNSQLLLEQRMDSGIERCWGTSDTVIVSDTHIEIIDFKYGAGVYVDAENNSQLRIYGLGALRTFGELLGNLDLIVMTVHQPRMDNVSSEEMHPDDLLAWSDGVAAPAAAEALHNPNAKFGPSEKACRWCPAAGICRARIEKATLTDFGDVFVEEEPKPAPPETLTPEEIGRALKRVGSIKAWCAALEASALEMAYGQGRQIPGWKVVRSGGQRSITDPAGAIQTLIDSGFKAEQVAAPAKAKGIGELEKLLGKDKFKELLEPFVSKSSGRESLVPEEDKRDAISPASEAAEDFKQEDKAA